MAGGLSACSNCIKCVCRNNLHICYLVSLIIIICYLHITSDGRFLAKSLQPMWSQVRRNHTNPRSNVPRTLNISRVISPFRYQPILQPTEVDSWKIFTACIVHSAAENFSLRMRIRYTWGKTKGVTSLCERTVFVLGRPISNTAYKAVVNESLLYQDILMGDFTDSYKNLMLKARTALQYATNHFSQASFVLKVDDDIFVNIEKVGSYLQSMLNQENFISCHVWHQSGVFRDKKSKLYVPRTLYKPDIYPAFCSGSAYVMSYGVVSILDEYVNYVINLPVDDVTITGLARCKAGNIKLIDNVDNYLLYKSTQTIRDNVNSKPFHYIHNMNSDVYYQLWHSTRSIST